MYFSLQAKKFILNLKNFCFYCEIVLIVVMVPNIRPKAVAAINMGLIRMFFEIDFNHLMRLSRVSRFG